MKLAANIQQNWFNREEALAYTGYSGTVFDELVKEGTFIAYNPKSKKNRDKRYSRLQIDGAMKPNRGQKVYLDYVAKEQMIQS